MKKLLFMLVLMISTFSFAQSRVSTILAQGTAPKWEISQVVTNKTDTIVYFYMGYQNQRYQHITDIGSIIIGSKADAESFIAALRELAEAPDGSDYNINVYKFKLSKYNFSKNIYISDKSDKFTTITKKQALSLASALESNLHHFLR